MKFHALKTWCELQGNICKRTLWSNLFKYSYGKYSYSWLVNISWTQKHNDLPHNSITPMHLPATNYLLWNQYYVYVLLTSKLKIWEEGEEVLIILQILFIGT